jgi:CspA family cold shock protein
MFKIVHLVTGVAALLLSLIPSLKTDATPFLQQPDAVYLALLGLLNLVLAPVVPLYYRGARQQLQHLACALLVVAVVLQTLTLLARPEMGNLAAQDAGNRDTGTVKWFNTSKGFGFISRDSGDDIFVHFRAIRGEGHRILVEGQRVEFSVMHRDKGLQAEDVVAVTRR